MTEEWYVHADGPPLPARAPEGAIDALAGLTP